MNKFNEARAKNIEDLKKVVKDIEDGKIKFYLNWCLSYGRK